MSVVIIILLAGFVRTLVGDGGIQQHPYLFCIRPVIKIPIITLNHTPAVRTTKGWMFCCAAHKQNIYHSLFVKHLKRSIMSKWISINEAAVKYGYNKEVIWLWAEMNRFPISHEGNIPAIDEECFEGFLAKCKRGITAEYIDTLEELCMAKTRMCDIYTEIIGSQDKELVLQREKIAQIDEIQATMKRQNARIQDCKKVFAQYEKPCNTNRIRRLWSRLKLLMNL
uniref:hypothetical protein n=1 Tax=Bacteroides sp. TaxID=29523 RepID=UPI0025BE3136|nr:hypothetical protein [Bacteroides sp.]